MKIYIDYMIKYRNCLEFTLNTLSHLKNAKYGLKRKNINNSYMALITFVIIAFPSPIKFSFHQAFGHKVLKVSKPIVSNRTVYSISENSSHNLFPTKSTMCGIKEELTATQK